MWCMQKTGDCRIMIVICTVCYESLYESDAGYAYLNLKSHASSINYLCQKCYKKTHEVDE